MNAYKHTIWRWIAALAVVIALQGCKTTKEAEVRTEYRYITQTDTVMRERWDTVRIEQRGDTVYQFEKLVEREYYSTIYRDTLRQSDTLRIEKTTVQAANCKGKWWRGFGIGALIAAIILIAIRIVTKLYIKK